MALLALAFLLGLVVGGGVIVQAVHTGHASWIVRGRAPGRQGFTGYSLSRIDRLHFNLDQSRRDSIGAITCRGVMAMDSLRRPLRGPMDSLSRLIRPALDSLFQTIRPAVETRREQTRTEIRALLTPPQQERYDSMNRTDDEQRQKAREQGSPSQSGAGSGPCNNNSGGPGPRGGTDRGSR